MKYTVDYTAPHHCTVLYSSGFIFREIPVRSSQDAWSLRPTQYVHMYVRVSACMIGMYVVSKKCV